MPSKRQARPPDGLQEDLLDEANRRIVEVLTADPRMTTAELAREIGMSAPAVRERVGRLERAGVIGYRLVVDPAALGLAVTAWVRVRPGPGQLDRVAELAERTPQVSECHRITGEDCFLMKVHVPAVEDLGAVLDAFLLHGQTTSSFVVSTPVAPRTPAP
ncbi:Lrp/AsnC family transcriptional regulator [Actinophytocola xanthii]|uniref:AsnC family transcriptional regulator n=1 Tax=Actinophytocola xanthii TaxID=1912961 RepID=A0A1Q8CE40_9PSEU|nr:Lrp/AsnC family transcriptional regulator [Actinophytocola xanthii]OLF12602.1 AsnC family transcriptional regulator [Actinophytocola xanthii]